MYKSMTTRTNNIKLTKHGDYNYSVLFIKIRFIRQRTHGVLPLETSIGEDRKGK